MASMILGFFGWTYRCSCVSTAGHVSQQGQTSGWAPADFLMSQMAAFSRNVHGTSLLCPAAGVCGFCKNIKPLSVQFGENLPMNPKVVGERDRQTYANIPKKRDSKVQIALGSMVKNRPKIHSHKYFQAQNSGRSFIETVQAGAQCVAPRPCPSEPCGCNLVVYFLIFACLL